jgi:hypothetical protein
MVIQVHAQVSVVVQVIVRRRLGRLELQPPHSTYYYVVLWKKGTMEGRQETQNPIRFWPRLISVPVEKILLLRSLQRDTGRGSTSARDLGAAEK